MSAQLYGKGVWAWLRNDLSEAIELAHYVGARYVFYHVAHFPRQAEGYDAEFARVAASKIRDAGLWPVAWYPIYLDSRNAPWEEAHYAYRAVREDGYLGVVLNAEYPSLRQWRARWRAKKMARYLVRDYALDPSTLFFCSYPAIKWHLDKRFDQFMPVCRGGLLPMCYGTYQLAPETVIAEWAYGQVDWAASRWGYRPHIYPVVNGYHDDAGAQLFTPKEFAAWLDQLARHDPPFVSIYRAGSFDCALWDQFRDFQPTRPEHIYRFPGETLEDVI